MNRKRILIFLIIIVVFAINLSFGLPRLSKYSSVDEPYWTYDRTPDFWRAIVAHKWKNTNINDKPGVTVAAISGLGLRWVNPIVYKSIRQESKNQQTSRDIININFALRLPIYLTTLAFLLIFFWLLKKLLGNTIALLSFIFLGLSPIILGVSLIINPDSLLWGFLPLSILSYLVSQKNGQKKYLIFSGVLLGLSLLTKYVANIGYIYILSLLFLEYIYNPKITKSFFVYFKKSFLDYIILVAISCVTFFALYPACWHDPQVLLDGTILSPAFKNTWSIFTGFFALLLADMLIFKNMVTSLVINFLAKYKKYLQIAVSLIMIAGLIYVFINIFSGMRFHDFVGEMASPKGGSDYSFMDFIQLVATDLYGLSFGLTPLVFIFFVWAILANIFKKKSVSTETNVVLYFSLFIFLYYIASTANHVTATIRYQIITFPLASIIAAIGVSQFINLEKIKKYFKNYLVCAFTIIVSFFSLYSVSPHFFVYSSHLLPKQYILNLKDMGDGSFEMARYLNSLPNAQNLIIWSDKGAVCETFLGKCNVGFNKNDTEGFHFDYFVVSLGRKSRSLKLNSAGFFEQDIDFVKLYSTDFQKSAFQVNLNSNPNNFVRVVKASEVVKKYSSITLSTPYNNNLEIIETSFLDRVCNVSDYGAVPDGKTLNTESFAKAISDCVETGGGQVFVPNGTWLTGPIQLKSNINLHLEKDAEILFSKNFNDYLPVVFSRFEGIEYYNFSPLIYANGMKNIAITGEGKLNGQGEIWWNLDYTSHIKNLYKLGEKGTPVEERVFGEIKYNLRPDFIGIVNCQQILLDGITIIMGPMWTVHPTYSRDIIIRNININTFPGPSTDGIIIDSSRNVLVENATLSTGDDAIVIKSGRDNDGRRVNIPSENVVIKNCTVNEAHGAIAIGSEISGSARNIFAENISIAKAEYGFRLKSNSQRGGTAENIWLNNFNIKKLTQAAIQINSYYERRNISYTNFPPVFQNINFSNFTSESSYDSINLFGLEESPIKNLSFKNINIQYSRAGAKIENIENSIFDNVNVASKYDSALSFKNSNNILFENSPCQKLEEACLYFSGETTKNIQLTGNSFGASDKKVILGNEISEKEIIFK